MPPTTPESAAARAERQKITAARRATLQGREADSYTDRSNYDRCISLGTMGSLTPKIYNSGNRIVQGPGWFAWSQEMIHETRVIPTDGRATVSPAIKSWMGTSVGRWEGDTLVVTTTGLKPESADRSELALGRGQADRALHPRRPEDARIQDDGGRPEDVDGTLDDHDADSAGRGVHLRRVRVPRRQLHDVQHPQRLTS